MSEFNDLASLLERAAAALRKASDQLCQAGIFPDQIDGKSIDSLPGWRSLSVRVKKGIINFRICHGVKLDWWHKPKKWPDRLPTVGEVVAMTIDDFLEQKHFGMTSLKELRDWLSSNGLHLKDDFQTPR